jgi:multidrug efflux pump subunit AcrB
MLARILYTHSRYLALVIIAITVVGYTSFSGMGRQEDPSITPFIAKVTTYFPGASPARVEALISKPLEDAVREQAEVTEIKSTSTTGVSVMTIEVDYRLPLIEIDRVWSELRDKVAATAASFPEGATPPDFDNEIITAFVKIISISGAEGIELPPGVLRREAEAFADAARRISRTRRVMLYGLPEEEIRVEMNEALAAQLGISIDELTRAIRNDDAKTPAGKLEGSNAALAIELAGEFTSIESVRDVVIRALPNGRVLRVGDVATVTHGERTPPPRLAFSNGKRSVLIGVEMDQGYQVDAYSEVFDEWLENYQSQAAGGLSIEVSYDQSGYTEQRLSDVAQNLLIGVALVLAVLLVTLGWRAATVVAVVLPLCTLLSMVALLYLEVPIHQMSVTGLVVALGLLVDGSIVMADEVRKRLLEGLPPMEAMVGAVSRMRVPLIASTLTTVLAFMPMAILAGPAGDFLGSIATSVIVMLVSSMVLALTVTPVLAAHLLPAGIRAGERWWRTGLDVPTVDRWFRRSLDWSLAHPVGAVALALSLPIVGFLSVPTLTKQFFPGTDRDQFYLQITMPQGSAINDTLSIVKAIDERLHREPLVRRIDWSVGESAPAFYYNLRSNKRGLPGWSEGLVLTHDENQTDALIRRLQREFDAAFPSAQIVIRGIDQGPPVEAPVEVLLFGPDTDQLKILGETFRTRLEELPDVTHTRVSMTAAAPKLVFDLDEAQLRRIGLERVAVANAIDAALRGRVGGSVLEDTEQIPVRAQLVQEDWQRVNELRNLRIPVGNPTSGKPAAVPLSTLGDSRLVPDDSPITRIDGERVNQIQGYLTRGVLPEEALALLKADLQANPIPLPPGYHYRFGGDSEERAQVVSDLMGPLGLIVSALFATILLTFNSWRLSAVAFLVCGCSFGLSFLSLAVFRYPLGIQALIGVIGSIGVSINAAIIILTALQQDAGASKGDLAAVREVVLDASRHIVSTTITTFGGFLPLILEGSQFWPPFAMAIAGGVLLSTIISFYLVPPMYVLTRGKTRIVKSPIETAGALL